MRNQLDATTQELTQAQATIARYERQQEEWKTHQISFQQQTQGLDRADAAVQMRDKTIADLSSRFEQTLQVLQKEREQQRQRRQIIFPTTTTQESSVESRREAELMLRIQELERRLNETS